MLEEFFKVFYSGLMGIYILAGLIFLICSYTLKIRESASYLILSATSFIGIFGMFLIVSDVPERYNAWHLYPFACFTWVMSFATYYAILVKRYRFRIKATVFFKIGFRILIFLTGCLSIFFGIDEFREIFLEPSNQSILNYTLRTPGRLILIGVGLTVMASNAHAFYEIYKVKKEKLDDIIFWGCALSFLVAVLDTLSVINISNLSPITGIGYLPAILCFLLTCFSSPHFQFQSLSQRLAEGFAKSDFSSEDELPLSLYSKEKVYIKELLEHLLAVFEGKKELGSLKTRIGLSKHFFIMGEKSEVTIVLYNFLEEAIKSILKSPSGDRRLIVRGEKVKNTKIEILYSGTSETLLKQMKGPSFFKMETTLLDRMNGSVEFGREKKLNLISLEFDQ